MDTLDFALLGGLFRSPRASYEALGQAVGLTANAVKARLKRLESTGLLQGFAATPEPSLLGLHEGVMVFNGVEDLDEREADVLRDLPDVSGVRFVDVAHDRTVTLSVLHRDDADWERIERAAVSILGKPPTWHLKIPRAPTTVDLTPNDWRIARELVQDARVSLKDLVRRTRLSAKTAKRRLDALLTSGAVRIEPVLSTSEAEGAVLFSFLVVLREGADARDLLALLPATTIIASTAGSPLVAFHVQRRSLREAQADHRRLKASPLVERVLFEIATRRVSDAWLADATAAMLAPRPLEAPAPAAPPVPVPRVLRG